MDIDALNDKIDEMERKLDETLESSSWNRGPVNDAIKIVVPMMKDQLAILRDILAQIGI